MQKLVKMLMIGSAVALAGCVGLTRTAPVPGDTVADTQAKFGAPTAVYPISTGQVMEYATGPMGQYTWMANVGPDGRLVSFEQVLTGEKFATLKIGKSRKEDVLRTVEDQTTIALRNQTGRFTLMLPRSHEQLFNERRRKTTEQIN